VLSGRPSEGDMLFVVQAREEDSSLSARPGASQQAEKR
jgi:hypothetical protein